MTKRDRLESRIKKNFDKIEELQNANIELTKESCLLSDKKQWFTEEEEEHVVQKRPRVTKKFLIGRIHWNEFFRDESFPDDKSKGVSIERSRVVRINGEWQ